MEELKRQYARLLNMLNDTDPTSEAYGVLLDRIEQLGFMLDNYGVDKPEEPKTEEPKVEEPKEEPKFTTDEPWGEYSKEEVREILTDASKNGVKIQPIMKQFIPEGQPAKLSSVPVTSYAALVEAVRNAG